jgi:hypothetical protein
MSIMNLIEKTRLDIESCPANENDKIRLHRELDMSILEHSRFQEVKSLAHLQGKLSLEDAQTIYSILGETPDVFNQRPLETKVVMTLVFKNLLEKP